MIAMKVPLAAPDQASRQVSIWLGLTLVVLTRVQAKPTQDQVPTLLPYQLLEGASLLHVFLEPPLPCWHFLFPIPDERQDSVLKSSVCCHKHSNRVLIEVDLLLDPPTFVNVVLLNGTSLSQQVMYEFLPCFCKRCWVLRHSVSTCNKEASSKHKNRPHDALTCSGNSSPSVETAAVEKQQPFSAVPPTDP
ncbi:hypothetical protein Peur_068353 [Populus x canadensis]